MSGWSSCCRNSCCRIVETYFARGAQSGRAPWRGSPFADNRIRAARALPLRAHPNKEVNIERAWPARSACRASRFYDLFQLSAPAARRAPISTCVLCVESAIAKLSSGSGKIADVCGRTRLLGAIHSRASSSSRVVASRPPSTGARSGKPSHGPAGRARRLICTICTGSGVSARRFARSWEGNPLERRQQFDEIKCR